MEKLLEQVIQAVRECREIMVAPFSVDEKDGISNIVTSADKEIELRLRRRLLEILPQAGFLGEEGDQIEGKEYLFVVDPIDGTSNFARGIHTSAISVGLTKNGVGILGVVYDPFHEELYYAQKGCGAFRNGEPIHVSGRDFAHGLYYTALSLYRKDLAKPCMKVLKRVYRECDDFRREGSAALELCRLASGCGELYFEIRVFPWDVCAAEVILTEAGGCYKRLYDQNLEPGQPFPIVAANCEPSLEKLLKIVKQEIPKLPADYHKEVKRFAYVDSPKKVEGPCLDPELDLQELYGQCAQELTLQQSKRDQLIAFYLTITGLVASYIFTEIQNPLILSVIFAGLFVIGCMWVTVILRYRLYKEMYWICCRTVSSLYPVERGKVDKARLQHIFYATMVKCAKSIPEKKHGGVDLWGYAWKNRTSAEYIMFMTMVLLAGLCGAVGLVLVLLHLGLTWSAYVIAGVLLAAFLLWQTLHYNRKLIDFYAVTRDQLDASFNRIFKMAWQLHFFSEK